jgi:hypothetical protein
MTRESHRLQSWECQIRENPGADFIAAFIITLIIVALIYPITKDIANELTNFAFFSLVAGVILQALALRRDKKT